MRVYISCHHPDPANALAAALTAAGHRVISAWHSDGKPRPADEDSDGWAANAQRNVSLLDSAEAVVVVASPEHLTRERCVPGGKFVEAGYALNHALASGGPLVVTVGGVENGMLYHPAIRHCADASELLSLLGS